MDGQSWGKSRQGNRASEQQGTKSSRRVVHRLFFPLKYTALNVGSASKLNLIKEGLCGQKHSPRKSANTEASSRMRSISCTVVFGKVSPENPNATRAQSAVRVLQPVGTTA